MTDAKQITLRDVPRPEVLLGASTFLVRPATKALTKTIAEYREAQFLAEDDDAGVKNACELLDELLERKPGKRKDASAVIAEKWDANELAVGQIVALVDDIIDAATDRPT